MIASINTTRNARNSKHDDKMGEGEEQKPKKSEFIKTLKPEKQAEFCLFELREAIEDNKLPENLSNLDAEINQNSPKELNLYKEKLAPLLEKASPISPVCQEPKIYHIYSQKYHIDHAETPFLQTVASLYRNIANFNEKNFDDFSYLNEDGSLRFNKEERLLR